MFPFVSVLGRQIPMYGLSIVAGVTFAAFLMLFLCRKKRLCPEDAAVIGFSGIGLGFIGAKLTYIFITFSPMEVIEIIFKGEWSFLLSGGFVFYGGLIFGILGAVLGAGIAKASLSDYENVLVLLIPFVHAFGRMGCLFAGCCYGKRTDSPFHIVFTHAISDVPLNIPLVPVQIYEAVFNFILFAVLILMLKNAPKGILTPIYLCAYSAERFVIEFWRYDEIRGIFGGLSTSQWISIFLFAAGVIILMLRVSRIKKTQK